MRKSQLLTLLLTFALSLGATTVFAQSQVEIEIVAEKEITLQQDGREVKQTVIANIIEPGDIIIYSLNYKNVGSEPATDVVVDDPIPEGALFLPGSQWGDGATISFSIDQGKSFGKPSLLIYEVTNPDGSVEHRQATAEKYTHIRWRISEIPAGGNGQVGFRVKVK